MIREWLAARRSSRAIKAARTEALARERALDRSNPMCVCRHRLAEHMPREECQHIPCCCPRFIHSPIEAQ